MPLLIFLPCSLQLLVQKKKMHVEVFPSIFNCIWVYLHLMSISTYLANYLISIALMVNCPLQLI